MKTRLYIIVSFFLLAATVPVVAQEISKSISKDQISLPVSEKSTTDKVLSVVNPFYDYEKALAIEKSLEKQLSDLERINNISSNIIYDASWITSSLNLAENRAKKRNEALTQLSNMMQKELESRAAALDAVKSYHLAAVEALKAIKAYTRSNKKSATRKCNQADAALDKKENTKRKAEIAISKATDSAEAFNHYLTEIIRNDDNAKNNLLAASSSGNNIISSSKDLKKEINVLMPHITRDADKTIGEVRTRVEDIIMHISDVDSVDTEAYKLLITELKGLKERERSELTSFQTYFENSINAVIKSESLYFVISSRGERKAAKFKKEEVNEASILSMNAQKEAKKSREAMEMNYRSLKSALEILEIKTEGLPNGIEILGNLIIESKTLLTGFDLVENKIQSAVDAKQTELKAARQATDNAYLIAYGHERQVREPQQAACGAAPPPPKGYIEVENHVYAHVYALRPEPKGYGAYTYVLFPYNPDKAKSHVKKRYEAILQAIYNSTTEYRKFTAPIDKEKSNLFCIPFKANGKDKNTVDGYDPDLARSFLATAGSGAMLKEIILNRIGNSPGPFLLTTRSRLSAGSSKNQLLFVDLSRYDAEDFDSILASYKSTIVQQPPKGQIVWTPPVKDRVVLTAITTVNTVSSLSDKLKKLFNIFASPAHASQGEKE